MHPSLKQLIRLKEEFLAELKKELPMSTQLVMLLMLLWEQNAPQSKEEFMMLMMKLKKPFKNFGNLSKNLHMVMDMLRKRLTMMMNTANMLTHMLSKKKSRNLLMHSTL